VGSFLNGSFRDFTRGWDKYLDQTEHSPLAVLKLILYVIEEEWSTAT
jgi:hypothetical protein